MQGRVRRPAPKPKPKPKAKKIIDKAQQKGYVFRPGGTLDPLQEPDDEILIDLNDESDDDLQEWLDEERPDFPRGRTAHPLWLLYGGQILWATDDIRFNTKELEFFRRRLQHLLYFLLNEFPNYENKEAWLLLALQGFFVRNHPKKKEAKRKSDPKGWTKHLATVGIVLENGTILPLVELIASQGQGKQAEGRAAGLPNMLLNLWFERELVAPLEELREKEISNFKHGAILNIKSLWQEMRLRRDDEKIGRGASLKEIARKLKEFCKKLNDYCDTFVPETEEDEKTRKEKSFDLGLRARRFDYSEDVRTIDNAIERWKNLPAVKPLFEGVSK